MSADPPQRPLLQTHGALHPESLYVERAADEALYQALRAGQLCYVLAPRQIGKSSLRVRTARRLSAEGARCAELDLTRIGSSADSDPIDTWYFSLVANLAEELGLPDPRPFWLSLQGRLPADRMVHYLRQVVLTRIAGPVVIFLDEIDYLRSLALSRDELFASLRGVYGERARDPVYRRLSFCLLGVAAPADLIQDPAITPFNIGRGILLEDFARAELSPFAPFLRALGPDPGECLDEIYRWTCGHPYMTQRLCEALLEEPQPGVACAQQVERCVRTLFLRRGRSSDPSLSYAEKRLDSESNLARKAELLALYRRLLVNEAVDAIGEDPNQIELQLCGMIASYEVDGVRRLRVRNPIFTRVFGLDWLRTKEAQRDLMQAQRRWLESGRSPDALLRGTELERARAFASRHLRQITADEQEFLLLSLDGARREAEERRQASEAAAERERRERAEAEAASLRELNQRLERALEEAENARREANKLRYEAVLARERAEAAALTEKSLRAGELAVQPDTLAQALVLGLQAARPDYLRSTFTPAHWTGLIQATVGAVISRPLSGHNGTVRRAAFSPDGCLVVSASGDGTVRLWDQRSGLQRLLIPLDSEGVWSAVFSPDGKRLLCTGSNGSVHVLDAQTGQHVLQLEAHAAPVFAAAFSPHGARFATASADHTARIFRAGSGALLHTLVGHSAEVTDVAFSPDGRRIVTASADRSARIFSAETGACLATLQGHTDQVWSAAFSPTGLQIVTAGWDQTARLWDERGQNVAVLQGHNESVWRAAFSADGKFVITASDDKTARIWIAASAQTLAVLRGHTAAVWSAGFSADHATALTSSTDGTVRIWSLGTGSAARMNLMHDAPVWAAAPSPDGDRIVTACADHQVRIWDTATQSLQRVLSGHTARVWSAEFSRDGARIVTSGEDQSVFVWDAASGQRLLQLPPHEPGVSAASFSPDGARLVTAGWDCVARIWDAASGEPLLALHGHTDRVWTAAFSPTRDQIVTGGWDKTARLWDSRTGQCLLTLRGHAGEVNRAAFSPDGKLVVTASSDRTLRLWSTAHGDTLRVLRGHVGDVLCAAFAPDNKRVVSASWDGTVRVWDILTGQCLLTLPVSQGSLLGATFTPAGQGVLTAGSNGVVALYSARHRDFYEHGLQVLRSFGPVLDIPLEEIAALLSEHALEEVDPSAYLTVDTRPILGDDGRLLMLPYFDGASVQAFLDENFHFLRSKVRPYSYGQTWVLQEAGGAPLSDIGSAWSRRHGGGSDPRTLAEVGIRAGMKLEAVPLVSSRSSGSLPAIQSPDS